MLAGEHPYWVSRELFDEVVAFAAGYSGPDRILFTFDDGNISDLYAAEQLITHNLEGKFFVLTGRFGQADYLSRDDVRDLANNGFEVGLHGRDHVDWRRSSNAELEAETVDARMELADAVGTPPNSVAIPFGAYDRRVINHLRAQHFSHVYTSDSGLSRPGAYFQPRTSVMAHHRINDVIGLIEGRGSFLASARNKVAPAIKRWL